MKTFYVIAVAALFMASACEKEETFCTAIKKDDSRRSTENNESADAVQRTGLKDYVNGQGWITIAPSGGKGTFGFNVGISNQDDLQGTLTYTDRDAGIRIIATQITDYTIINSTTRYFYGNCTLNGVSGYTFFAQAIDNGSPGSNDVFYIELSIDYTAAGNVRGGNIFLNDH